MLLLVMDMSGEVKAWSADEHGHEHERDMDMDTGHLMY